VTLRARLLVGLLVLAAAGLAVAGALTYRQEHQFLNRQFNQQLTAIVTSPNVSRELQQNVIIGGPARTFEGIDAVAELRTPDGRVARIGNQKLQLPSSVRNGMTFTTDNPHFRGVVVVDNYGNTYLFALSLEEVDNGLHHLFLVELFVASVVLAALAGLTYFVVMLGLRPLREMQETAGKIAAGDLSQRVEVVDGHTEVGQLGLALNEMLHQIETAFDERTKSEERLRRFVADASHELRTPLTSIRGYAELFRRGAADRPEDLAKTMRRIEEEAARMGILVDDLLLLARLDQGRPLEREPVDLTRITADAVDDARAIAPDRPIDYSPDGAIIVPGDEPRLRQVLANLLQNATRHTPPDTPVHVRVATEGPDAVIEVRDEGPGLDPETASRVFERFWRSDPSRARQSGGAGLGLAIVAAIASAHGGRAEVDTAPGQGATFRVLLPRTKPATPPPDEFAAPTSPPAAPTVPNVPLADLEELEDA
jgi:two-component system OmpR family sensor kinase